MEIDSDGDEDAVPRQEVTISNFTFIHRNAAAGNGAAIRIRGGADYTFANGLITTGASCLRVDSATTVQPANPALDENGPPVFQSVSMQCNDRPFRGSNGPDDAAVRAIRSEEHTSELQSLMRISYAVFCLKKKKRHNNYEY